MISGLDASASTLHLLVWQALQTYTIDALLALLDDRDPIVRTAVARELQTRGGVKVFEASLARCDDQSADGREIAAFILGQLGAPDFPFRSQSIPRLVDLAISDRSSKVRAAAVAALGHLRAVEGRDALFKAARDVSANVRAMAAVSIGGLGGTADVLQVLGELLHDEVNKVREWAELGRDIAAGAE
jgi:HEAT repeat protein